ncbi:MAG TPA: hypothetical protein VGS19_27825 [Streptosporangiaceae bacterium]|nr:hypothetical protein [Streptosporangiaceae bacterium]
MAKLDAVSRLPSVELGIIGFAQRMPVFPFVAFSVRDDNLVIVEHLTGEQGSRRTAHQMRSSPTLGSSSSYGRRPSPGQRPGRSSSGRLRILAAMTDKNFTAPRLAMTRRRPEDLAGAATRDESRRLVLAAAAALREDGDRG